MASTQKELRQIIREAERQGWRVEQRKDGKTGSHITTRALAKPDRTRFPIADQLGELVLDGFLSRHADTGGPVVSQNTETGELGVTIALDADSLPAATAAGFQVFAEGMIDAGFLGASIDHIDAAPAEPDTELEPA
jgi:hypothetical protein